MGKCFEFAYFEIKRDDDLTLVHGTIIDPWDGARIEHAWVESPDGFAWDWQTVFVRADELLPIKKYRKKWKAKPYAEYNQTEAFIQVLKTGHYGPWHDF